MVKIKVRDSCVMKSIKQLDEENDTELLIPSFIKLIGLPNNLSRYIQNKLK